MCLKAVVLLSAVLASVLVLCVEGTPTAAPILHCFTCANCPDTGNGTFIETAPGIAITQCAPTIDTCFKYFHSDKRVQRGCSPTKDDDCPSDQGGKFNLQWCYTCGHNKCNSGRRSVEVSIIALVAAGVGGFLAVTLRKNN